MEGKKMTLEEKLLFNDMKSQDILETPIREFIEENRDDQAGEGKGSKLNMAVDIGTSRTRAVMANPSKMTVYPNSTTRILNEYAKLDAFDLEDVKKMEVELESFDNLLCIQMVNKTNPASPIYGEEIIISKGLISDKLGKTSNYALTNSSKFIQTEEYVVNAYTSVIATMVTNYLKALESGDKVKANMALTANVNLAFMLPDEEKNNPLSVELTKSLTGFVEFTLPLFGDLKGRFSIEDDKDTGRYLNMYGEAECAIYYHLVNHKTPENIDAFSNHGVVIMDVGEGSTDLVFFKERELLTKASITNRELNGSELISRTVRNIARDLYVNQDGVQFTPNAEKVKQILYDNGDLMYRVPSGSYDIAGALTNAKEEIAGELANVFMTSMEKNRVFGGIDNLFLVIFAGRTMTRNEKSPSLGDFLATKLKTQMGVEPSVCKIANADSNLFGAGLKLAMDINK